MNFARAARAALAAVIALLFCWPSASVGQQIDFTSPLHRYWERVPQDRFSKVMTANPALDTSGELPFLRSLLKALEIPVSSQLLVYSATSLQSAIVNPYNPRAIYFNDDTSVGFIPGGRIEISSLDPHAGMVFFIFERLLPPANVAPKFVRSDRCMNCHADTPSNNLPGLVVHSVAVTNDGSSLRTYRRDEMGHTVSLSQRFGGWHLTGQSGLATSHANLLCRLDGDKLIEQPIPVGKLFEITRYPLPTSDILPHLVHEHQVGFLNLVVQAIYLHRENDETQMTALAKKFADYILFANEAKLPPGIVGDAAYARDFQSLGPASGKPMRDFDLKARIFKYPASYLILSTPWQAVPPSVRRKIYDHLRPTITRHPAILQAFKANLSDW